jgi:hypothetical protein
MLFLSVSLIAQPVITSINPITGPVGTKVSIVGTGFSNTGHNYVYFGPVKANIVSTSAGLLTVEVPPGAINQYVTITADGLTSSWNIPFQVTATGADAFSTTTFSPVTFTAGYNPTCIAATDLDGDGYTDLITFRSNEMKLSYLRNKSKTGVSAFAEKIDEDVSNAIYRIIVADINGDGKQDIITVDNAGNIAIRKNNSLLGNISLAAPLTLSGTTGTDNIATGDLNADGKPDIIAVSSTGGVLSVFKNTGTSFGAREDLPLGLPGITGISAADLNGDNKADLVIVTPENKLYSYKNINTSGVLSFGPAIVVATGNQPKSISLFDLNNDGKADVVVGNNNGLSVYTNSSSTDISLSAKTDYATGSPLAVVVCDLNGDGKPELIARNTTNNKITVLANNSNSNISFAAGIDYTVPGNYTIDHTVADIDGDGLADILASQNDTYDITILKNKITTPVILSFSPASAGIGAKVTITGHGLDKVNSVRFGDYSSTETSFRIVSPDTIIAILGAGYSGRVTVATPYGQYTTTNQFNYVAAPVISSINPVNGTLGQTMVIKGTGFTGVNTITAGDVALSINSISPTQINATILGGASGKIVLSGVNGSASYDGFTYVPSPPTIKDVIPQEGIKGSIIEITGTDFTEVTAVTIGGKPAAFNIKSFRNITATVADSANLNDEVTVTGPGGTVKRYSFVYKPMPVLAPVYQGAYPNFGSEGSEISIYGENLISTKEVTIGGTPVMVITRIEDNAIYVRAGKGSNGKIKITTTAGSVEGTEDFQYTIPPAPVITSFNPVSGGPGAVTVDINGSDLGTVTSVTFGGIAPTSFSVFNYMIRAIIDTSASGEVKVDGPAGAASKAGWVYSAPVAKPEIISFSPVAALPGETVTINGNNLEKVTAVRFGGVSAASFKIISNQQIAAVVGGGASGTVTAVNASGIATKAGFTFTAPSPAPYITSYGPQSAAPGTVITVRGTNFNDIQSVTLGGVSASFTVNSSANISVIAPAGPAGEINVINRWGRGVMYAYQPIPQIISFQPATASIGDTITINGVNFSDVTAVSFGGTATATFFVVSATKIIAKVEKGSSGNVVVSNSGGSGTLAGFTVKPPSIFNISPAVAEKNDTVFITGADLSLTKTVSFGGTAAKSFTQISGDSILAVVAGGTSGSIVITTPFGSNSMPGFTYYAPDTIPPVISGFSPLTANAGTTVTITGQKFSPVPENNTVYFGAVRAAVLSATETVLTVSVPSGATYAPITVTTPAKMTAYSSQAFILTFNGTEGITDSSFSAGISAYTEGTGTPVITDLNDDGKIDVAIPSGANLKYFVVLPNNSNNAVPTFKSQLQFSTINDYILVSEDFDGDGKKDIGGCTDSDIFGLEVSRNITKNGNIQLESRWPFATIALSSYNLSSGDCNMDGKPDLALLSYGRLSIHNNISTKRGLAFDAPIQFVYSGPESMSDVVQGDLDGDGKTDIVVTGYYSGNTLRVYHNTSKDGKFSTDPALTYAVKYAPDDAIIADLDRDGKPEIILVSGTSNFISVYKNNSTPGSLTFAAPVHYITPTKPNSIAAGDIDGDGYPDLVTSNITARTISVWKNTSTPGNIGLVANIQYPTYDQPGYVSIGDMNGDGKPDLFYTNMKDSICVLLNRINRRNMPVISSFTPSSAGTGTTVTISGENFTGATAVSFGGKPVTSFQVVSAGTITAIVAEGSSGSVSVITPNGTVTQDGFVFNTPAPVISAFTPASGREGTTVKISGTNFGNASAVSFGGVAAKSFTVVSSKEISAVVGNGATGNVLVTTPSGTAVKAAFSMTAFPPVISGIDPPTGGPATQIRIMGGNLSGATNVTIGGIAVSSFIVNDAGTITAVTGSGKTGNVEVTTPAGTVSYNGFVFADLVPKISNMLPGVGKKGDVISIRGKNFIGTKYITFGGSNAASFNIVSDSVITVTLGQGEPGRVILSNDNGTANYDLFNFQGTVMEITSFSPKAVSEEGILTIRGRNFANIIFVKLGSQFAPFQLLNDSTIQATVVGGETGTVTVISTVKGAATMDGFIYLSPDKPHIKDFSPKSAQAGTSIVITGDHLSSIKRVQFGGLNASVFIAVGDSMLVANVGKGASGNVWVQSSQGKDSVPGFTWLPSPPQIDSLSRIYGKEGDNISIYGKNLTGATAVTLGGVAVKSFNPLADYWISAVVGKGATGNVVVTTPLGTAEKTGFHFVEPAKNAPLITSFSPTTGGKGTVVTIRGQYLSAVSLVTFGFAFTSSYRVLSDSVVTAVLGTGASGNVTVSSGAGTVSLPGFTYLNTGTALPSITDFSPAAAAEGEQVTLTGSGFENISSVKFGDTAALSYTVVSPNKIIATVGRGGSGLISVENINAQASIFNFQFILRTPYPQLSSFKPGAATTDEQVTITGRNFGSTTAVTFGGAPAKSFEVLSDGVIIATVDKGASGKVNVTTLLGVVEMNGFTYKPGITTITSFSPATAASGEAVTINGKNFSGATSVTFGNVSAASFIVLSDTTIAAYVGNGASGKVAVTTANGIASADGFTYKTAIPLTPVITGFNPASATTGELVTISGKNFNGATSVTFGNVSATSYIVLSDSGIAAYVGSGASGKVAVTTANGTASLDGFIYRSTVTIPQIYSFSPTAAATGTLVIIKGQYFTGTTGVRFGNVPAISYSVISDSVIEAIVSNGATGNVDIFTSSGSAQKAGFTFIKPLPPVIIAFLPVSASEGTAVTITGTHFSNVDSVTFGGTPVKTFTIVSDSTIIAIVGTGTSGSVMITTPDGKSELSGFTYIQQDPQKTILVYPNPATGLIWVKHPASATGQLRLTDSRGNLIRTLKPSPMDTQTQISLADIQMGYYLVTWTDGSDTKTSIFIVQ